MNTYKNTQEYVREHGKIGRNVLENNKNEIGLVTNIFYMFNLFSFLRLFNQSIKAGVLSSILIIITLIIYIRKMKILRRNSPFLIFVAINIATILCYSYNGLDIYFYFAGVSYNLIPSLLYILGTIYAQNVGEDCSYKILYSNLIILSIGIIVFILRPDFYSNMIGNNYYRMESYMDSSMHVGNIAAVSIPIYFYNLKRFNKIQSISFALIILVGLVLSMQRSAWVVGAIVLVVSVCAYLLKRLNLDIVLKSYFIVIIIVVGILLFIKFVLPESFEAHILRRFDTFDISMITSRSGQWKTAFDLFLEHPLGLGLGSAGHKTAAEGIYIVPDGNYFRILVETGIFGFLSFVYFNIQGLKHSWKKEKYIFLIFIIFLLQAIGTNVFDLMYSSFVYWFLLGYIINKKDEDYYYI